MILAAYRNPPYRSPTPRGAAANTGNGTNRPSSGPSLSPPPQRDLERRSQSPKRKREESITEPGTDVVTANAKPTMLSVATTISYEDAIESGAESPRTKVAERLRGLELEGVGRSPRKKVKRTPKDASSVGEGMATPSGRSGDLEMEIPDSEGPSGFEVGSSQSTDLDGDDEEEVGSPSPSPMPVAIPPHRRPLAKVPSLRKESSYLETRAKPPLPTSSPPTKSSNTTTSSPPTKRRLSSPPPPPSTSTLESMALDPTPLPYPSNYDPTALTWHPTEITGATIDPSNPDDDGEGINGIGFRPTPAMAAARSLKRKKQVEEWRTREMREERRRRAERRKGASGVDLGGVLGSGKRVVRFVDG